MSGNLFNDPRINKSAPTKLCTNLSSYQCAHTKTVWKLI